MGASGLTASTPRCFTSWLLSDSYRAAREGDVEEEAIAQLAGRAHHDMAVPFKAPAGLGGRGGLGHVREANRTQAYRTVRAAGPRRR